MHRLATVHARDNQPTNQRKVRRLKIIQHKLTTHVLVMKTTASQQLYSVHRFMPSLRILLASN